MSGPVPVAARSKAWVCGRSPAGIAGSNPMGGHEWLYVVCVVCCEVEGSATGRSLVQRDRAECGVPDCDLETSTRRGHRHTKGCRAVKEKVS